jgi:hypothetical protein
MSFTNSYLKNNGGENPNDTVLKVSKTVSGLSANTELYFPFAITVTAPETVDTTTQPTYKAYLMKGTSVVSTIPAENIGSGAVVIPGTNDYFLFTAGTAMNVNLKHDQWLSFIDLPVGTSFEIIEGATPKYTPNCDLTLNGAASPTSIPGTENNPLTIPVLSADTLYIGELENIAAFENVFGQTIPTGISVNDLPYIVLIGVAVAALVAFVAFKSRKREENDA